MKEWCKCKIPLESNSGHVCLKCGEAINIFGGNPNEFAEMQRQYENNRGRF